MFVSWHVSTILRSRRVYEQKHIGGDDMNMLLPANETMDRSVTFLISFHPRPNLPPFQFHCLHQLLH